LCQKPWQADQGGEFAANVNKMIRNLNFQQVQKTGSQERLLWQKHKALRLNSAEAGIATAPASRLVADFNMGLETNVQQ
jgi:hypothetical protein